MPLLLLPFLNITCAVRSIVDVAGFSVHDILVGFRWMVALYPTSSVGSVVDPSELGDQGQVRYTLTC